MSKFFDSNMLARTNAPSSPGSASGTQVHLRVVPLSTILNLIQAEGLIATIPSSTADIPKPEKRIKTMSLDHVRLLLTSVEGTELAAPVFCAAVLGMAWGELCGLKWENAEMDRRRVSIVEQRLIKQGVKGKAVSEGPTKRDSRNRAFVLPPVLWNAFVRLSSRDCAYVCARKNSHPWNPEHLTGEWARLRRSYGLDLWHFHGLRHCAASTLAALGSDMLTIAAVLGHSSIDTIQLYAAVQE